MNRSVIVVDRELAEEFGLHESIIITQLDFRGKKDADSDGWFRINFSKLAAWDFPFWSSKTIKRNIQKLLKSELVEMKNDGNGHDKLIRLSDKLSRKLGQFVQVDTLSNRTECPENVDTLSSGVDSLSEKSGHFVHSDALSPRAGKPKNSFQNKKTSSTDEEDLSESLRDLNTKTVRDESTSEDDRTLSPKPPSPRWSSDESNVMDLFGPKATPLVDLPELSMRDRRSYADVAALLSRFYRVPLGDMRAEARCAVLGLHVPWGVLEDAANVTATKQVRDPWAFFLGCVFNTLRGGGGGTYSAGGESYPWRDELSRIRGCNPEVWEDLADATRKSFYEQAGLL